MAQYESKNHQSVNNIADMEHKCDDKITYKDMCNTCTCYPDSVPMCTSMGCYTSPPCKKLNFFIYFNIN